MKKIHSSDAENLELEILSQHFGRGRSLAKILTNNCVIYTRVSTAEQQLGYSLGNQRRECELLAERKGYVVMGYFGGTYESAKSDERKEFTRMLHFVKHSKEKISYIIVNHIDRFSRTGANAIYIKEQLKKHSIYIVAAQQPVDTSTPTGDFQQNMQILYSEYENQLRREKCMAGTREALSRGVWCGTVPREYDVVVADGKKKLVINEIGKMIRQAFLWKAEGITTEEVKAKLKRIGYKISSQRLSAIFRNPFYCGYMAHKSLEGKLVEGQHEKLISIEVFKKVNGILAENSQGYKVAKENEELPLKRFLKCDHCGNNMPGYIVKKKNVWYYKCRVKGCCNNKSAKKLHQNFMEILSELKLAEQYVPLIAEQMKVTYHESNQNRADREGNLKAHLAELERKLERLEERYILEEITSEMYQKYSERFKLEKLEVLKELENSSNKVSNLDECISFTLNLASNLPSMWASADYLGKQKLQRMIFPEGISYNKQNDQCRTTTISDAFLWIACQQQSLSNKKTGIPMMNISYSGLVAGSRIELPTSGL